MMKNKKLIYIVLPLFINLFHALTASAKAMSLPKDSVRISAQADSVKRMMRDGVSLKEVVVSGSSNKEIQMKSALNVMRANQKFIEENFSGWASTVCWWQKMASSMRDSNGAMTMAWR